MNRILLFGMLLFLMACNANQNNTSLDNEATAKGEAVVKTSTVKPNPTVKRDSNPVPQRQRYMVNTARQKTEINANFPYDIDLKTAEGKVIKSDQIFKKNGKPTIFLFWLTTCYPCRIEMQAIEKKYEAWTKEADFNLYAISTDFSKNYENFAKRVNESNWPWEAYNDVNREFRLVLPGGLNGLPQTFVLDANGEIVYHKRKYSTGDEDKIFAKVKALASK